MIKTQCQCNKNQFLGGFFLIHNFKMCQNVLNETPCLFLIKVMVI